MKPFPRLFGLDKLDKLDGWDLPINLTPNARAFWQAMRIVDWRLDPDF
ncbi:MAG TPA: hypothetical protein VGZ25_10995 [Gemmataceae bacterium]|nr:hypothetical protein [Gemmataceae bacterium]